LPFGSSVAVKALATKLIEAAGDQALVAGS
jgi:hypothetical protein